MEQQHNYLPVIDFEKFKSIDKVKLEFIELELDWPSELSIFDLKNYILLRLSKYGEPLRWAITSLTTHSGKTIQKISIEAVLIISEEITKDIKTYLNLLSDD